ncbi:MAG: proton-conducting transporter membrane subunit [Halieaceae bacterium]|jgi:formate hydrogenlyase subunit 3/multisubunit Na+/H+ antiporter MnhD subunit|nr:proton-conducting transporter membrane subunit [Halieaceae bacterium]
MTLWWSTLCVAAPLLAAVVLVLRPKWPAVIALVAVSLVLTGALGLASVLHASGPRLIEIGGWGAPLGIAWRIDGLTVTLLLMAGIVGWPVTIYARGYFGDAPAGRHFWPLWMLLLTALCALFLSNDLFNWYVTLELLSLSAVALVTLSGKKAALDAAQRYLFTGLFGSLLYLMGVALIYKAYGVLDLTLLRELTQPTLEVWVALGLMAAGLLVKSALFPLHFWLPAAHGSAPAPVSAILSALVVKGAFYILLRLWFDLVPAAMPDAVSLILGGLGAGAIIWGSLQAFRATRLKMLVAYSTVAQLGYLALFFPLSEAGVWGDTALTGLVYFIFAHACAKGAMFLAAGNLQRAAGHDELASLAPVARALPVSMFAFAIGGVSIMGLPPSGGFIAKWTLLNAAIGSGGWVWVVVMVVGGLLSAAYIFRVLALSFAEPGVEAVLEGPRVAKSSEWASLLLASIALLLGLNALPMLDLLNIGLPQVPL